MLEKVDFYLRKLEIIFFFFFFFLNYSLTTYFAITIFRNSLRSGLHLFLDTVVVQQVDLYM